MVNLDSKYLMNWNVQRINVVTGNSVDVGTLNQSEGDNDQQRNDHRPDHGVQRRIDETPKRPIGFSSGVVITFAPMSLVD
jgi:hypothetical protein